MIEALIALHDLWIELGVSIGLGLSVGFVGHRLIYGKWPWQK